MASVERWLQQKLDRRKFPRDDLLQAAAPSLEDIYLFSKASHSIMGYTFSKASMNFQVTPKGIRWGTH